MPTLAQNNLQPDDPNDQPKIVPGSTNSDLEGGIGALHQMILGWLGQELKVVTF